MSVEGLAVLFVLFKFCVARPKEFRHACQVVAEPLTRGQEEGCVIFLTFVGGGALAEKRGNITLQKTKRFDCTLGYPGEDVRSAS